MKALNKYLQESHSFLVKQHISDLKNTEFKLYSYVRKNHVYALINSFDDIENIYKNNIKEYDYKQMKEQYETLSKMGNILMLRPCKENASGCKYLVLQKIEPYTVDELKNTVTAKDINCSYWEDKNW